MGWSGGSQLFSQIIDALNDAGVDEEQRKAIYLEVIDSFENQDCDTPEECLSEDPAFDDAYYQLHPDQAPPIDEEE